MPVRDNSIQKSAGWIIYYIDKDAQPRFLLLKRYALSKKIEWVAPKWKVSPGENPEETAIREICEETWIKPNDLVLQQQVWVLNLSLHSEEKWNLDKDIIYFLVNFKWDPSSIKVDMVEWYLWIFKWYTVEEVLGLLYYENFRELFRKAYKMVVNNK